MSKDDDDVTLCVVSGEKMEKNDGDNGNPLTKENSKDEVKTDDVFTDETGEPPESFFDDFLKDDFLESLAVVDAWDPDGDENGSVEEDVKQCKTLEEDEEKECEDRLRNSDSINKREGDDGRRNKEKEENRTRHERSSRRSSVERGTGKSERDKERETVEKYLQNIDKNILRRYLSEKDKSSSDKVALDKYLHDISKEILSKIEADKEKTASRSSKSREKRRSRGSKGNVSGKDQGSKGNVSGKDQGSKGNVSGKDQESNNRDTGKKEQRKSRERSSDRKVVHKRERDRSSERKRDRSTERKRDKSTERKRDRSTERKRDRSTERRDRNTERRERGRSSDRKERDRSLDRRERGRSGDRRGRERSTEKRRRDKSIEQRERNRSVERRERSTEKKETNRNVEWKEREKNLIIEIQAKQSEGSPEIDVLTECETRESPEKKEIDISTENRKRDRSIDKTINEENKISEQPLGSDFHGKSNSRERSSDRHDGDETVDMKEKAVDKRTLNEQSSDSRGSEVNKQDSKKESDTLNENTIKDKDQDEKLIQTAQGIRKRISINFQKVAKKPTLIVSTTQSKPFPLNETKLDTCIKDLDDLLPPGTEDLILPAENEKPDKKVQGGKANLKSLSEWLRKDVNTKDKTVDKFDMFRVDRPMEKSYNDCIDKDVNTKGRMPIMYRPKESEFKNMNTKDRVPIVYRPAESEFKNMNVKKRIPLYKPTTESRVPILYRPAESEFKNMNTKDRVPIAYRLENKNKRSLSAERKQSPLRPYDYDYQEESFKPKNEQFSELIKKRRLLESNVPKFTRSQSTERLIDKERDYDRPFNLGTKDRWHHSPPGPNRLVRSISPDRQYIKEKHQFKNDTRIMMTKKGTINDRFSRSRSRGRHDSHELSLPRSRSRDRQYKKPLYKYEDKKGISRRSLSQERGKRRSKRSQHSPIWDKGKRRPHDLSPISLGRSSPSLSFELSPVSSDRSRRSPNRRSLDRLSRSLSRERRRHEKKRRNRRSYSRGSSRSGSYVSLSSSDDSRYRRRTKRKRSPFWKEIERKFANDFVKTVTSYNFSPSTAGTVTQAYASSSTTHPTLPPGGSAYAPAAPYSNVSAQYSQAYPPPAGYQQPYPQVVPPDNQNVPPHYMPPLQSPHDPNVIPPHILPPENLDPAFQTHVPPPVPPPVYNVPPPAVPMEYPVPVLQSSTPSELKLTLENVFKNPKKDKLRPNLVKVPPPPNISKKMSLSSILEASVKVGGPKDKKQMLFDPTMVMRCEEAIHALQDDLLLVPSGHFVLQEASRPYSPTTAAAQASKEDFNKFQSPILRAQGAALSFTCLPDCEEVSGPASESSYTYKLPKKNPVPVVPVEEVSESQSVGIQCVIAEPSKSIINAATMTDIRGDYRPTTIFSKKCLECEKRKNIIMVWNATQTPRVHMYNKSIQLSPPRQSARSRSITPPRTTTRRSQRLGKRDSPRRDSPRRDSPRRDSPRRISPRRDSPRRISPRRESPRRNSPRGDDFDLKIRRSNSPQPGMRSTRRTSNFDKETLPSHSSMYNPNPNKPLAPAPPKGILKTSSNPYPSQTSPQSHEIPNEFSRYSSLQTPSSVGLYSDARDSDLYGLRSSSSSLGSSSAMQSSLHELRSRSSPYSDSASSSSRLPNPFSTSYRGNSLMKSPVTGNLIPDVKKQFFPR